MALPKTFRFKTKREIQGVLRSGAKRTTPLGRMHYRTHGERAHRRFLAVVSKRVSGESTRRHLLERRLDGLFLRHAAEFKEGFEGVLIVSSWAATRSRRELGTAFRELTRALGRPAP